MPASDELLLKFAQEGASGVASASGDIAGSLDKITDAEKESLKASKQSEESDKQRVRGLADLKAGLDLVGNATGKVIDFVKDAVNGTMKYAAEVRDLSRAIGANAEETSSLIQVADDVNVSVGTLEAAFKAAIKNGIQPNIATLARLSDEYNAIQDPVMRSQFAMDKFGRAGLEMAKILEQGGDSIRSAAKEAKNLGLTLDDTAVKAARDLEINMDNLGDKLEAFKTKVGNAVIPVLNEAANTLSMITDGTSQMADAFTSNQQRMFESVLSGEMSVTNYNAAITGMANSVSLWDFNTGVALKNQYTMSSLQLVVAQNVKAATDSIIAQRDASLAGMTDQRDAILAEDAAMAEYNRKLEQKAAADKVAAEAEAAHRASIASTIAALDAQAMSLSKVNDAQAKQMLAQANLDTIKKAYESGTITQEQFNAATEKVLLNYDLATPKSIAMAKAQEAVTKEFLSGKTTIDEFVDSAGKIPKIAADGKLSLDELTSIGIKSYEGIHKYQTQAMDETSEAIQQTTTKVTGTIGKTSQQLGNYLDIAKMKTKDVDTLIKSMPDMKTVKLIIDVEVKGDQIPSGLPPARAYGGPVSAGMPYMVGERGPEMFVPSQNGNIVPNQVNNYGDTNYNITTDRTGLAFIFERQRMAEARM